jgi:hypothetical protein
MISRQALQIVPIDDATGRRITLYRYGYRPLVRSNEVVLVGIQT